MLKEQLFTAALKIMGRVYEAKDRLERGLNNQSVQYYLRNLKKISKWAVKKQWDRFGFLANSLAHEGFSESSETQKKRPPSRKKTVEQSPPLTRKKSSIRKAQDIRSERAEKILSMLEEGVSSKTVTSDAEIQGKKSLASVLWALGQAQQAQIHEGISVHDISALLFRAAQIELYPINISRIVHGHSELIKTTQTEERTKRYLLTERGKEAFQEVFG